MLIFYPVTDCNRREAISSSSFKLLHGFSHFNLVGIALQAFVTKNDQAKFSTKCDTLQLILRHVAFGRISGACTIYCSINSCECCFFKVPTKAAKMLIFIISAKFSTREASF